MPSRKIDDRQPSMPEPDAGRDVKPLFAKQKIAHSKRLFESSDTVRKMLTIADLDKGYKVYVDSYASKEDDNGPIPSMYM